MGKLLVAESEKYKAESRLQQGMSQYKSRKCKAVDFALSAGTKEDVGGRFELP
ncbi:MAG TPA: hypothetical protein VJ844_11665 [Mucilaginibacter sp.]|nr:hypothetical protein [Mucilaginibacter sp.]